MRSFSRPKSAQQDFRRRAGGEHVAEDGLPSLAASGPGPVGHVLRRERAGALAHRLRALGEDRRWRGPRPPAHRRSRYQSQHVSTTVSAASRSRPSAPPPRANTGVPAVRLPPSRSHPSAASRGSPRPLGQDGQVRPAGCGPKRTTWQRESTVAGIAPGLGEDEHDHRPGRRLLERLEEGLRRGEESSYRPRRR